jgi:hypothetical protein
MAYVSLHEGSQVLPVLLADSCPNDLYVLLEEWVCLHGVDVGLHLLGYYFVVELPVA